MISAPARSASHSLALLDLTSGFHQSARGEAQPVMHSDTPSPSAQQGENGLANTSSTKGNWRSAALAPDHFGAFKCVLRYPNAKVKPEPASAESFSDPWMVAAEQDCSFIDDKKKIRLFMLQPCFFPSVAWFQRQTLLICQSKPFIFQVNFTNTILLQSELQLNDHCETDARSQPAHFRSTFGLAGDWVSKHPERSLSAVTSQD